eukprot:14050.XXX_906591_888984_1 [CDS] Oithona nana genome sequencing.
MPLAMKTKKVQPQHKMELWKIVFLSLILPPMSYQKQRALNTEDDSESQIKTGPFINPELSPNVTGVLGKEVRLACHVEHLGNKTVSWMRHRDIHLLTVGRYTYTSDQRFSAHHVPMTHFWQLRIRGLTHADAGKYECQVSTTPPRGHQMYLKVVEPFTQVLGGPDMHVDRGSTINLTCVSKFNPKPPSDVTWYLNDKKVDYDSPRGGVSVVIEKAKWTTSHLLIQKATSKDSGIYKCVPLNAMTATINLHVLRGKNPDAWQTSGSSNGGKRSRIRNLMQNPINLASFLLTLLFQFECYHHCKLLFFLS